MPACRLPQSDAHPGCYKMPVLVGEAHEQAGHGEDEGADGEDQGPVEVVGGHPHHQQGGGEGGNKSWTHKNLVRNLFIFIPNSEL